jgi:hypothetical protein
VALLLDHKIQKSPVEVGTGDFLYVIVSTIPYYKAVNDLYYVGQQDKKNTIIGWVPDTRVSYLGYDLLSFWGVKHTVSKTKDDFSL